MTRPHSARVADRFGTRGTDYDSRVQAAIPYYDEGLDTLVTVARRTTPAALDTLDLGTGTGRLNSCWTPSQRFVQPGSIVSTTIWRSAGQVDYHRRLVTGDSPGVDGVSPALL